MSNVLFDALLLDKSGDSKTFLELPEGRSITYAEALATAHSMAHVLAASGVTPGERVAVQVDKSPEALCLYFACIMAGAVLLPLNTAYTAREVAYFLEDAEPVLLVCDARAEAALAPLAERQDARLMTLNADGSGSLSDAAHFAPKYFDVVARGEQDLAAILYTSGTTGRAKGAMLSHSNLLSNAEVLADTWRFSEDDVLLHALPIFHTHGLFVATNIILAVRGSMLFLPKFDATEVLRLLPKATSMMGVPTFYTRLLDRPDFTQQSAAHIRLFISGSAPLLAETHRAFEARTGQRILERYGMTETNMNTSNPYDGARRAGTVGFPLPGTELRIAEPDSGAPLPEGEIGIIEVRGPNVFLGYWRMPEKTASEFRDDGFFITGDLGLIDEQGYLQIVGRAKDLIISGGFNIYPKEIESALDSLPGIVESAVIGVSHPDFGEAVVAVAVPQPGAAPEETAVIEALSDSLARFKQPKRLFFAEELPRNTMGKVQKNLLREQYKDLFS